jgi:hypothetical protein
MEIRHQRLFSMEEETNYHNSLSELTRFLLSDDNIDNELFERIAKAGNLTNALKEFEKYKIKRNLK